MKRIYCEVFTPRLQPYFEGELSEREELEIDQHLDRCEECSLKLDALVKEGLRLTLQEEARILRWLRADYNLSLDRKQKGIKKILTKVQQLQSRSKKVLQMG